MKRQNIQRNTTNQNDKNYPELVASFDTRPGNKAGLFYQCRTPYGATMRITTIKNCRFISLSTVNTSEWVSRVLHPTRQDYTVGNFGGGMN